MKKKTRGFLMTLVIAQLLGTDVAPALAVDVEVIAPNVTACFEEPFIHPVWMNIYPLDDGGFLLAGDTEGNVMGNAPGAAGILDAEATTLSPLFTNAHVYNRFWSPVPLAGGGYAMLTHTKEGKDDMFAEVAILRVRDGEIVGVDTLAPGDGQITPWLFPAEDGYFVFFGERRERDRRGGTFHVPTLEKRNVDGEVLWRHVFGQHELSLSGGRPVDGGTVFYGSLEEQETGTRNDFGVALKMSDTGELLWLTESPSEYIKSYADGLITEDGGLLAAGAYTRLVSATDGVYEYNGILARFAPDGTLLWERMYHFEEDNFVGFASILATSAGYYVRATETGWYGRPRVLTLDKAGEVTAHWVVEPEAGWDTVRAAIYCVGETLHLFTAEKHEANTEAGAEGAPTRIRVMTIPVVP